MIAAEAKSLPPSFSEPQSHACLQTVTHSEKENRGFIRKVLCVFCECTLQMNVTLLNFAFLLHLCFFSASLSVTLVKSGHLNRISFFLKGEKRLHCFWLQI